MTRVAFLALLTVVFVSSAAAQTMDPPPRVTRPPRTQGTTHSLSLGTSLFGGYDHSQYPAGTLVTDPSIVTGASIQPGTATGWGSARLNYSMDSDSRSFSLGAGGTANTNSNSANDGPVYGLTANAGFSTSLWRSMSFSVSQNASRSPYYSTGVFGALPPGSYSPDSNPVNGIVDGHLTALTSAATLSYPLTRRTNTSFSYSYHTGLHDGSSSFSNEDHSFGLNVGQQITRTIGSQVAYRLAKRQAHQTGLIWDGLQHGLTYGLNWSVPLGRSRTLAASVGGGADLVDMNTGRYWQPTYYASLGTDIARTWSVSTNYSQVTAMLYSPLAPPDSYLTQTLGLGVGGNLAGNLALVVHVGATKGDVGAIQSITGSSGHYIGLSAGTQLSVQLPGGWSAVMSTNYYKSELSGAASQLMQSAGIFERKAVRGGFTWSMPLLNSGRRRSRD
jgi:hypothetical protein